VNGEEPLIRKNILSEFAVRHLQYRQYHHCSGASEPYIPESFIELVDTVLLGGKTDCNTIASRHYPKLKGEVNVLGGEVDKLETPRQAP
jgi:hypothetical protein